MYSLCLEHCKLTAQLLWKEEIEFSGIKDMFNIVREVHHLLIKLPKWRSVAVWKAVLIVPVNLLMLSHFVSVEY